MNSIMTIAPYKWNNIWVFDDSSVGLQREAFVSGADTLIDKLVEEKKIKDPHRGFLLQFSNAPFPGFDMHLLWKSGDINNEGSEGNHYMEQKSKHELWLCPALFCYFTVAPRNIFVLAKPIPPKISQHGAADNKKRKVRQYASKKERP